MTGDRTSRRRFLALAGTSTAVAIAGCSGGGDGGDGGDGEPTTDELGPVPQEYETATSIGGSQRDPDALQSKSEVQYQSQPQDGKQCSGCTFYVEDENDDGLGACSIVEGKIGPEAYCVSYAPYQG
jgi:hypothetical protein